MPRRLLLAVCALALTPAFFACGDDDGGSGITTGSTRQATQTPASVSTASPKLTAPVSKYSVSIDDLGTNWITDVKGTQTIDTAAYARQGHVFSTPSAGEKLLNEWGYQGGYQTGYSPEGRDQAVLNGAYYVWIESHLFSDEAGAQKAFDYFNQVAKKDPAQPVSIQPLGNKSAAYLTVVGTITGSNVKAAFHQVITRRGNLVTIVLTKGAESFMKSDAAWEVAKMADDKALGTRPTSVPTPTSDYKTPTPTPKP
jgi:hypothetical protein